MLLLLLPLALPALVLACSPQTVGNGLDVPGHDLRQAPTPTQAACGAACCADPKCAGALFEPQSAVTYGGCTKGQPCCFLKTSVAHHVPSAVGTATLLTIPGRDQDDEKLNFVSATLGSHMVLQRAPAAALLWGHTAPGALVTTTMTSSGPADSPPPQTFNCTAGADGTWRQSLPPTPGSADTAYTFTIASSNSTAERATLSDVLFGEVFLCGGQSNMEFGVPAVANTTAERQRANHFPSIRLFTVGHATQSASPLKDLQTVWRPWAVASNETVARDYGPGHTLFSTFSAVCWFFGQEISQNLANGNEVVPVGLISNNQGGTKLEVWTPATSFGPCNRSSEAVNGPMWNAMILPYAHGPMAIAGFAWYQGEANTASAQSAQEYACLFPQTIRSWREAFGQPNAWFGFVQLSTWCALPPLSLPEMREAQMAAATLPNVGWATNADHGMGCNIHPAEKQYIGRRLGRAAVAVIKQEEGNGEQVLAWRSPRYVGAIVEGGASVRVTLQDVGAGGLELRHPSNYRSASYGDPGVGPATIVDCLHGTFPINATYNESMLTQCAWAGLEVDGAWVNASVAVDGKEMVLTPASNGVSGGKITASAYGWGPIPMLNSYDATTGLPVLPWNHTF